MGMEFITQKNKCTGCGVCHDSCSLNAIDMKFDKNGFYVPVIDNSKCISCGKCRIVCPSNHPFVQNKTTKMHFYAGWSSREEVRDNSTSGGIFYEIASGIIKEGGVVYGATITNNKIHHIKISDSFSLRLLQGSKYGQSITKDIYRQVRTDLKKGVVLFSGTPCQIAGIKNFIRNEELKENLFTCEIICHGIPSNLVYNYYLKQIDNSNIIKFRSKKYGDWRNSYCIEYIKENGTKVYSQARDGNFYLNIFSSNIILRDSCYTCNYARFDRISDILLGDYWGCKGLEENELKRGVSLIGVNTTKGELLIEKIRAKSKIIQVDSFDFLKYNPRIFSSQKEFHFISLNNYVGFILKYFPSNIAFKLFSGIISIKDIPFLPYKFLRKVVYVIYMARINKELKKYI